MLSFAFVTMWKMESIFFSFTRIAAGSYAGFAGHNEKEATGHYPVGQNTYGDAYGVPQVKTNLPFFFIWFDFLRVEP